MLVRLKPFNPRAGQVKQRFGYAGIVFEAGTGWYLLDAEVARHLKTIRQRDGDVHSAFAFDVATEAEARRMDEVDEVQAREQRPVDQAKIATARPEQPPAGVTRSEQAPIEVAPTAAPISTEPAAKAKPTARTKKS